MAYKVLYVMAMQLSCIKVLWRKDKPGPSVVMFFTSIKMQEARLRKNPSIDILQHVAKMLHSFHKIS